MEETNNDNIQTKNNVKGILKARPNDIDEKLSILKITFQGSSNGVRFDIVGNVI